MIGGFGFGIAPIPPAPFPFDPVPLNQIQPQALTSYRYLEGDGIEKWRAPKTPLFRFGAQKDLMVEMVNVKDRIMFKVFSNLIEVIIMEGADEYDLAMAMWMITHVPGHLFINLPTADDPKKLKHLANVTKNSRVSDLVTAVVGHLIKYPAHLVLQSQFAIDESLMNQPELQSREAMNLIYEKVKDDYLQRKI